MRGAIAALGVAACFMPAVAAAQDTTVQDPWEDLNRDLYAVHDAVDRAVLEPVARGYRAVAPEPARQGVRNFLNNLRSPVIFVNDVLQGEPSRAGVTVARFGLNTTIGLLGVLDPATNLGLERHDEDFGQTLAVWGVDSGPYLFVPVLGPTTVRDSFGRIVDIAFDPLNWADFDDVDTVRVSRTIVSGVDTREGLLDAVDDVRSTSIDPYVTFRTTFETLRAGQITNGRTDVLDLPSFDESFESYEEPAAIEPAATAPAPETEEIPQHSDSFRTSQLAVTLVGDRDTPTSSFHTGETP